MGKVLWTINATAKNVLCAQFVIQNTMPIHNLYLNCAKYLKFNDLYATNKLLIFYHNLLSNNTSSNFKKCKPTIPKTNERFIIRSPKYTLPSHNHECIKWTCRYQLPSLLNQYNANGNDAENNMAHKSSSNPIKTVNIKSLKQYKTLFIFHYLSLYSNVCNIKSVSICQYWYQEDLALRSCATSCKQRLLLRLNTIILHINFLLHIVVLIIVII